MKAVNVLDKFDLFSEQWSPRRIGELNGQQVIIAKLEGEFIWHSHAEEDELFYVVKGELSIEFRDRTEHLKQGEMIIVPKGVEHKPIADKECWVMLFEPLSTKHTGEVESERTVSEYPVI